MKGIASILITIILLSSCKSESFVCRRYTNLHTTHAPKAVSVAASARTTKSKTVVEQSMKTMQTIQNDTLAVQQSTNCLEKTGQKVDLANREFKKRKAAKSVLALSAPEKNEKQKGSCKEKKKDRVKNKEEGKGMAVFILLLGALSGLILSFVAYYMLTEAIGAALLFLLAIPFIVGTLILLMAYHTAGYKGWIILTYIGACFLIIPAVLVFFFTNMSH